MTLWKLTITAMLAMIACWTAFAVYGIVRVDVPPSRKQIRKEAAREWAQAQRESMRAQRSGSAAVQ